MSNRQSCLRSVTEVLVMTISILALIAPSALAKEISVRSRIDSVTVFRAGAEVTRHFTVDLSLGEHSLRIALPRAVRRDSIQIGIESDGDLSVNALETQVAPVDPVDVSARDAEMQEEIRSLRAEIAGHRQVLENAAFARKLVETLASRELQPQGPNSTPPVPEPAALMELLDTVDGRLNAISAVTLEAKAAIDEADERIAQIEAARAELDREPEYKLIASIGVVVTTPAPARFAVSYRLEAASWEPVYEARLTTSETDDGSRLILVRNARVSQTTAENWYDVRLTLSTATAGAPITAPTLTPQSIWTFTQNETEGPPKLPSTGVRSGAGTVGRDAAEGEGPSGRVVPASSPGFNARYAISGRVSIDNDGESESVRIDEYEFPAELFLTTIPKLDPAAYLVASFTPEGMTPLLRGRVMLFRNGTFLGESDLAPTGPGQSLELGFGADDLVSIEHYSVSRKSGESGLVSSVFIEERSYLTTVFNSHDFTIPITIVDQVPVSDDERIRVEILPGTTKPWSEESDEENGFYAWTMMLTPEVTHEITFGFRVSWPKGMRR